MTIQEVRVGNLVHHPLFGDYTFIRATAFNGFYIGHPEGNAIHIDDFSPIKITDVLLEQMGFKYWTVSQGRCCRGCRCAKSAYVIRSSTN